MNWYSLKQASFELLKFLLVFEAECYNQTMKIMAWRWRDLCFTSSLLFPLSLEAKYEFWSFETGLLEKVLSLTVHRNTEYMCAYH